MHNYAIVPIIALCCYVFLLLSFLASQKTRLINAFIFMLVSCVLWTGGSFLMRQQAWPGIKFWYDVSILGLALLPYTLLRFVREFGGEKQRLIEYVWLALIAIANLVNILTGLLLPAPRAVLGGDGRAAFVYQISWRVLILFALLTLIALQVLFKTYRLVVKDEGKRRSFMPIALGLVILFFGHIAYLLPVFAGFPVDVLSGILFVFCIFYALYKKRLFRLNLLVSKGVCYAVAAVTSALIFIDLMRPLQKFIHDHIPAWSDNAVLLIALLYSAVTLLIYAALKRFIDKVFVREEALRNETLREFGATVSKSLEYDEIMDQLIQAIKKTLPVKRVFVCSQTDDAQGYRITHSANPLDKTHTSFQRENPLVKTLKQEGGCLLMEDVRALSTYKSMWEEEKRDLRDMGIECLVPLRDNNDLRAIILLTEKERNARYSYDDIAFLTAIASICSIAVKNAHLYEKARREARTDHLTGLLNRKYFLETLQKEFDKNRASSLALIILNLDDFKLYNQLYGNKEGDVALQRIAAVLSASVGDQGFVARYSGKEFAILLPGYDVYGAKRLAENIRQQIASINAASKDHGLKKITFSGGICCYPYSAGTPNELVSNADMAVFQVKRSGKNAVQLCTGGVICDAKSPLEQDGISEIYSGYAPSIYALTAAIDTKDHYTFSHCKNVAYYASELALAMGMSPESAEIVREAAMLHDIGKIGINEQILNKPSRLTPEEYETMKSHVENSVGIIKHLPSLDYLIPAVLGHHERYDGHGYPRGIAGNDIPQLARILCVADTFDAMVSPRPYKKSYPVEYALQEITSQAGKQFDPFMADLFVRLVRSGQITPILTEIELKIVNK